MLLNTGTGKTRGIMEIVRELVFQHYSQFGTNPRLLICAPSDSAVDEIVARLLLLYPQSQDDVKSNNFLVCATLFPVLILASLFISFKNWRKTWSKW